MHTTIHEEKEELMENSFKQLQPPTPPHPTPTLSSKTVNPRTADFAFASLLACLFLLNVKIVAYEEPPQPCSYVCPHGHMLGTGSPASHTLA